MANENSLLDLEKIETQIIKTTFSDCFEIIPGDLTSEFSRNAESSAEFETYKAIFKTVQPEVCLDIGTNIGTNALFFAGHCRHVYAFEPNPYIYPVLQRNIERNNANISAFPYGLSDAAAELNLHIELNWNTGHSSFVSENASKNSQLVSTRVEVGDEVLVKEHIGPVDFIKIDTEGYETNVLLGLRQCILQHKPVIALEWNTDSTRRGFREHNLLVSLFPDYLCFGLGAPWRKSLYPTIGSKIARGIAKNFLKVRRPLSLQKFVFDLDYELIFLIPERFSRIVHELTFWPKGYCPSVGEFT